MYEVEHNSLIPFLEVLFMRGDEKSYYKNID